MRVRFLDRSVERTVAELVIDAIDEAGGYSPEEAIPGLVEAIGLLAERSSSDPVALLDEAGNLLADIPVKG